MLYKKKKLLEGKYNRRFWEVLTWKQKTSALEE